MLLSHIQVVVTGANGFVARHVRKFLSDNNVKTISISRKNFKKLKNETRIISKNYDEKEILPQIKNSDALVHLVGIGSQTVDNDYLSVNTALTAKIIHMCQRANIDKIIYNSGLGVSKNTTLGYFISKYRAEQHILDSTLNYTIFRPSYIVGKDDLLTQYLKSQIRRRLIKIPGSGKYTIQPIYIGDVCKIIFQSIHDKRLDKKVLDLVGSESFTFEQYVRQFSYRAKPKIKNIDLEDVYHDAITKPRSEFGVDDLNLLIGDFKGNHTRLKRLTCLKFQSVGELLKSCGLL